MNIDGPRDVEQLLMALYNHEIAISQLYGAYADQFSEYEDFWRDLSEEEINHAASLESLSRKVKAGDECVTMGTFSFASIEASIERMSKLIAQVEDADVTLIDALAHAVRIEEGMIENRYFEVFEGDSEEAIEVLNTLADDSRRHAAEIRQAFEECREKAQK